MKKSEYINEYCTGCGLCHSIKGTELVLDNRGFPTAHLEEKDDLKFFQGVCPVFYYSENRKHDVWGKVEQALVGYSSNQTVRYRAASGGALTELCSYLIESKKVDGILHTTFDSGDQTRTISCVSTTVDDIIARCGSRYSISVPLYNLMDNLEDGKKYAFVGKPCDVMALRRYLEKDKKRNEQIPYLLSFFCAGEPSVNAQDDLLKTMGCSREECKQLTYRGNGWPGYTTVIKKDGTKLVLDYSNAWGKHLGRDIRNSCRFCLDGTGDAADIVCADFWYLDDRGNPDFSEREGRNIIIARNEQGKRLLRETVESGHLTIEKDFSKELESELKKYQPAQYRRKGTMKSMIFAMKLCGRPTPDYHKEYLDRYASHIERKVKIKYFLGTIKRVVKGRI